MNTRQRAGATGSAGHTGIGRNDTTVSSRVDDTVDSPTGTGGGRERPSPIVLPEVLRSAIDRFGDGLDCVRRNEDGGVVVYRAPRKIPIPSLDRLESGGFDA